MLWAPGTCEFGFIIFVGAVTSGIHKRYVLKDQVNLLKPTMRVKLFLGYQEHYCLFA